MSRKGQKIDVFYMLTSIGYDAIATSTVDEQGQHRGRVGYGTEEGYRILAEDMTTAKMVARQLARLGVEAK